MRKKSTRSTFISLIVAGVLVVALLIAGTLLRMHTRDLGFVEAFTSFISDTFRF